MKEQAARADWKAIQRQVREQWSRISGSDVELIDAWAERVVAAVQKRYGRALEVSRKTGRRPPPPDRD